jgi:oligopeptide transport system substrate-binding protein
MRRLALSAICLIALTGCEPRRDSSPIDVSAISDGATGSLAERLLRSATAEGLVRFDATGGIEPGLAQRWAVSDDGLSIVFRLRETTWASGRRVTAEAVARLLRRELKRGSASPLSPYLTAITDIVPMTGQVIEVRLSRPRPDLLKLFAQPEFGLALGGEGTGPLVRSGTDRGAAILTPRLDPDVAPEERDAPPVLASVLRLRSERAALAIARFAANGSSLVEGGTLDDWPLLWGVEIPNNRIRIDGARGLFGLQVLRRDGFLASAVNRGAIAMAIDRATLTGDVRESWSAATTILPEQLDSAQLPARGAWDTVAARDRMTTATALVTAFREGRPEPISITIGLPDTPGGTMLWRRIAERLFAIGLSPRRVDLDDAADLRLVDRVAPYDSARWYLRNACQPCASPVASLIAAARDARTLPERAVLLGRADMALASDVAFIPIAQPLRWSLVSPRLTGWAPNPRALHPLNHLVAEPR